MATERKFSSVNTNSSHQWRLLRLAVARCVHGFGVWRILQSNSIRHIQLHAAAISLALLPREKIIARFMAA
jgi:hypothetical protein